MGVTRAVRAHAYVWGLSQPRLGLAAKAASVGSPGHGDAWVEVIDLGGAQGHRLERLLLLRAAQRAQHTQRRSGKGPNHQLHAGIIHTRQPNIMQPLLIPSPAS